ncbi:MAG: hypothetical protein RLZZ28_1164 [Bacteroidota bacterium]|jgi:hypothetical protein
MKRIVTLLLVSFFSALQAQNIDPDLLRVKQRLDSIQQFSADLKLDVDINFIHMPTKYAKMNYSQGKPVKFSSTDFVMIPKRGLDFSMNRLFEYAFITVPRGEETRKGVRYKAVNIIPTDKRADFSIALVLLDIPNNRVAETEINTKKDGTYNLILNYEKKTSLLPNLVEVGFEIEKLKIPLNFMGKDTDIDRKKMRAEGMKTGKIFLAISNYLIKHL